MINKAFKPVPQNSQYAWKAMIDAGRTAAQTQFALDGQEVLRWAKEAVRGWPNEPDPQGLIEAYFDAYMAVMRLGGRGR